MQENIVILGTGFIAGYLNRGLHYLFSELRQPMVGNVCAIGKHPEKLASRTNILKDCVLCTDPIDSVLFKFHPTILIVAVPPTVSVDITKAILLPYYNTLRAASQPLPDLYSFTPTPDENWYANLLGNDVSIVKILPNIFTDVHGIDKQVSASTPYPQHLLLSTLTAVHCLTFCLPLMEKQFLYLHLRH